MQFTPYTRLCLFTAGRATFYSNKNSAKLLRSLKIRQGRDEHPLTIAQVELEVKGEGDFPKDLRNNSDLIFPFAPLNLLPVPPLPG